MFEQIIESFRKASEQSFQMQQDAFKRWAQPWSASINPATSPEASRAFQKRWVEFALELLNKHRESLDANYRSGIGMIEQAFRVSEAKSPDDQRRMVDELWRKLFDTLKENSEGQFRDLQSLTERSFEFVQGEINQAQQQQASA
jgi:hypothetical protein